MEENRDLFGKLILFVRGSLSGLGDKHSYEDIEEFFKENPEKDGITRKVYGYCHSGTVLKIAESNPFHDPWDSGFAGLFYISKKDVREIFLCKHVTAKIEKIVEENMQGELETYNQWLAGETYGFRIVDANGNQLDSCWGFYGSDPENNGIFDAAGIKKDDIKNSTEAA